MLTISEIRRYCVPVTYQRGKELKEKEQFVEFNVIAGQDIYDCTETTLSAVVRGSGTKTYDVRLVLDDDDEITDYSCGCPAYTNYYGMCKHCIAVGLLYHDMQKAHGGSLEIDEEDEDSQAESLLGIGSDQNSPGEDASDVRNAARAAANRSTSERLQQMIRRYAVKDKMHLYGGYYHEVDLEPYITSAYKGYEVEFKIGSKRKYILKNIPKLVSDVRNMAHVSYGRNLEFVHDRTAFTERALKWIDLLEDVIRSSMKDDDFSGFEYSNDYRRLTFDNYGMQKVLEMYMNDYIYINGETFYVSESDPELTLHIKAQEDEGAVLSMDQYQVIYGSDRRFVIASKGIHACSPAFEREIWPFFSMMGAIKYDYRYRHEPMYLNKEDYEAFCGSVLPRIEKYITIDNQGVDFTEYMPKEPEFSLYLSQQEGSLGFVVGKAEVAYGASVYNMADAINLSKEYRNIEKENEFMALLRRYFRIDDFMYKYQKEMYLMDADEVYRLISEGMDVIREHAQVFVDEKLRGTKIINSPKVKIGVRLSGDLLEMDVDVPDMDMNEMYDILSAYKLRKKYYRMKNGDFMSLENNGMEVLSELTQGLDLSKDQIASGKVMLPKYRTNYVDAVIRKRSEDIEVQRGRDFRQIIRNMREYTDSDYEVAEDFGTKLRNYQKDGFRWLSTLSQWQFGGILADDMGLGKTVEMLAFLVSSHSRTLIVCPASLVYNWAEEAARFTPQLQTVLIAGNVSERAQQIAQSVTADIVITSYDLLKRDLASYKKMHFDCMVIDEAQYIKNASTQAAKAVKQIHADIRFAMTGTPIENRLSDLWSIFDFLMPGYLYDYKRFKDEIEAPVVQNNDEIALKRLHAMISPFILRRKKTEVLKDLPDKIEEVIYTQMTDVQKKLYQAQAAKMRMELARMTDEAFKKDSLQFIAQLTRLRQICCSPELIFENYREGSGKLDTCMELVTNAVDSGHKLLIFSQFTRMLDLIAAQLERSRIHYLYLSGKTTKPARQQLVSKFQTGDVPVFLISLKAGGTGLTLTAADMVIHYDPWWNVAAQNQATDRTHRIGQKNTVNVMKLVAKDTIEEKIIRLQERKAKLSEDVIEGGDVSESRLSREEILELLEARV